MRKLLAMQARRTKFTAMGLAGLAFGLQLNGCQSSQVDPVSQTTVIATINRQPIDLSTIEALLKRKKWGEETQGSAIPNWPELYRAAARELALETVLLAATGSVSRTLEEEFPTEFRKMACAQRLQAFLTTASSEGETVNVTAEAVKEYYANRPEIFEQPERRLVSHLFLRHEIPNEPERTDALLAKIVTELTAGETFSRLAKRHSQSENRSLGGQIGWVVPGRLPPALDSVVFSLKPGTASTPLETADGALLLYVSDVIPEVKLTRQEAYEVIEERLLTLASIDQLESFVHIEAPKSSTVHPRDDLISLVYGSITDIDVLEVAGQRLQLGELIELVNGNANRSLEIASFDERLYEAYRVETAKLLLCLQQEQETVASEETSSVYDRLDALPMVRTQLIELKIHMLLVERVARETKSLDRFYAENQELYRQPERLLVDGVSVPIDSHPLRQLKAMEDHQRRFIAGTEKLEDVAASLGGELLPPRWMNLATPRMEPKVRIHLNRLQAGEATPIYQLNHALQFLRLVERSQPAPRDREIIDQRLQADYLTRHQQRFYQELEEQLLDQGRFTFDGAAVVEHIAAGTNQRVSRQKDTPQN